MRSLRRVLQFALIVTCSILAAAQTNPNLEAGIKPYGSYDASKIDIVNLMNRNLTVTIPLVANPQRGALSGNTLAVYNNKAWRVSEHCNTQGTCSSIWLPVRGTSGTVSSGMQLRIDGLLLGSAPAVGLSNFYIFSVADSLGNSHLMGRGNNDPLHSGYALFYALDGSGYRLSSDQLKSDDITHLGDPSYRYDKSGTLTNGSVQAQTSVEDLNGNKMTGDGVSSLVDTVGRSLVSTGSTDTAGCRGPRTVSSAYVHTLPGPVVNGVQTNALIKECDASFQLKTAFSARDENSSPIQEYVGTGGAVQSYILYDGNSWSTSPQWVFEYADNADGTNYGDLTKVSLPTGGTITYTWETISPVCAVIGPSHTPVSRGVVTRIVDANDGAGPQTWNYKAAATNQSPFPGASFTAVSDPMGNEVVHTFWQQGTSGCNFYEVYTQYYTGMQSAGALVKSVQTDYRWTATTLNDPDFQGVVAAILPSRITTTLPNSKVSKIERDYVDTDGVTGTVQVNDGWGNYFNIPVGNLIEQREYDYGAGAPGALLKRTHYTYKAWQTAPYLNNNILDRVATATVYDGTGTMLGQTTYGYDETGLQPSGVPASYLDSGVSAYRGNRTSTTSWVSSTAGTLHSTASYYDSGMPYQATDPGGHATTYTYSSTYLGAYVTQTQRPDTHSPNLAHHSVSGTYDFNTGLLGSFTDENNQTSSYTYDQLARMSTANFPDGGAAQFFYPDLVTVELKKKIDTRWTDDYVQFDGIGRKVRTANFNGQSPAYDQQDICYWGDGTVKFKSYPYQGSGLSGTSRVCSGLGDTYNYDGLQRVTLITHSDSSQLHYQYNGAAVMTTDEGNGSTQVSHVSQSDGLGRLSSVCEVSSSTLIGLGPTPSSCGQDIAKTGFLTSYTYDALGNLKSVNQGGYLARSFNYDGLSRLTSATNPESGTVGYTYYPDGMVNTRTRPLPNQKLTDTAHLDTTTYTYDELHRQRTVQYSDGSTPTATFNYDETTVASQSTGYPLGHLTSEITPNTGTYFWNFDQMGRPQGMSQCTPRTCGSSYFNTTSLYDKLGDLTNMTLPLSGISLTYTYNGAARLGSIASSLNDTNHPGMLLSSATYGPFGITYQQLGNLYVENKTYAPRGWLSASSDLLASGQQILITPPASGWANMTINGSERSTQQLVTAATHSSGNVTISGVEQKVYPGDCPVPVKPSCYVYDSGTVWAKLNGTTFTVSFVQGSTYSSIASALATAINNNTTLHNMFTISSTSGVVSLTSVATGTASNFTLTAGYTWDQGDFPSHSSFTTAVSVTNGQNAVYQPVWDTGTGTLTINGFAVSVSYGQSSSSASVANAIIAGFTSGSSPVTVTSLGTTPDGLTTTLHIVANATGANTDYTVLLTGPLSNSSSFTGSSFTITAPQLANGADPVYEYGGTTLYGFTVPSGGFAPDGNILQANDTVNGNWSYTYDEFNRAKTGSSNAGQGCSWVYDRFGNRWQQNATQGNCTAPQWTFNAGTNQIDGGNYDADGNLLSDPSTGTSYNYDGENRLISAGPYSYVYDAGGRRVAKKVSGAITTEYLLDSSGEQLIELDGSGNVLHTNIFGNGRLVATYKNDGQTYFHFSDWLGNRRYQISATGDVNHALTCANLAFGDGLNCTGGTDSTEHHFTGKERDNETGLDYFGARYYGNKLGRWITPDWAAGPTSVPYAQFANPQSLNLYSYVQNNPNAMVDPEGHCDVGCAISIGLGILSGIQRDGGVVPYAKNLAIGTAKGAGSTVVNTAKIAAAGPTPGAIVSAILTPGPKALQPSNTTQAQASLVTQAVLPMAVGPLLGAESSGANAAQSALDAAIASRSGNPGAMIGAWDASSGATAVGVSGDISRLGNINAQIAAAADRIGGIGALNPGAAPVGCCAEVDAANQLANQGSSLFDINFTDAIRPRTGEIVPMCPNCEAMFLYNGED